MAEERKMADEKQQPASRATQPASAAPWLVFVQAPWGAVELSDQWKFKQGVPVEVSEEDARNIRDAAEAQGASSGLVVVERSALTEEEARAADERIAAAKRENG